MTYFGQFGAPGQFNSRLFLKDEMILKRVWSIDYLGTIQRYGLWLQFAVHLVLKVVCHYGSAIPKGSVQQRGRSIGPNLVIW